MSKTMIVLVATCFILFCSCQKELTSSGTSSTTTTTTTSSTTYYYQSGSTVTQTGKTYYSTMNDTSAVEVINSGTYTLTNADIWSSGATTSTDSSSFFGLNAAVLAYNSTVTLTNDSITTSGKGGNAVFSYGTGNVSMSADTINCTAANAHGIYAAGGATLTATNVIATTAGTSGSVIATDRGGGTITVTGGAYTASGSNSAATYSTGTINCTGTTLTATGAEAVVVEGANSTTLTDCTIKSTYNKWGALVYQSYSGDASGTSGVLTIKGGSFTYTGTSGGLFYNTNDSASIYLTGVTIANSSDTLVSVKLGSWGGSTATSGGKTSLICSGQTLKGLIYADANSDVTVNLTNSSAYTGKVNTGNTAKYAKVTIDASSTWNLTGDTYLSSLTDVTTSYSNIVANGYKLYVNGTQVL